MSETNQNNDVNSNKKRAGCLVWIFILLVAVVVPVVVSVVVTQQNKNDNNSNRATMQDIMGNWTEGILQDTYTFIPSCDIDGLELRFEIYDENYNKINTVNKPIGNVKEGQQYTVTITIDQYWQGYHVKTTVLRGTKS